MRGSLFAVALLALVAGGCGSGMAKVKGHVLENGQPKSFAGIQAGVMLTLLGPDGKPDPNKSFTAVLGADGSFEVVASGGELPPGMYLVTLNIPGKGGEKYRAFSARQELKSGTNDLTIDLAKPSS